MTTSGTYTFSVTRDDIIRQAMLNIGKLDGVETPDAQDITDCARVLNMMCKQWMGKTDFAPGLKVWTRRRGHLFLNTSQYQYSVGPSATGWTESYTPTTLVSSAAAGATSVVVASATGMNLSDKIGFINSSSNFQWTTISSITGTTIGLSAALTSSVGAGGSVFFYTTTAQQPLFLEAVVLRDSQFADTPMRVFVSTAEYDSLPNKVDPDNIGDPSAVYYEFQLGNSYLYLNVGSPQDVTKHLVLTYMEAIQDFNNPQDTPEYSQEWYLALCWGLSQQICPMYNAVWTQLMDKNLQSALTMAKQKDTEKTAMYFQPNED